MPAAEPDTYDEEADYYDDESYGPEDYGLGFWDDSAPLQYYGPPAPPQVSEPSPFDVPGYVRTGGARSPQFWQDDYRGVVAPEEIARASAMGPHGAFVTPGGQIEARPAFDPSKAIIPLEEAAPTPQEIQAIMERMAYPFLSERDREALDLAPDVPSDFAKGTSGALQGLYRTAGGLTSPVNLALTAGTAGMSAVPAAARIISGAFGADLLHQIPELSRRFGEAWESGDPEAMWRTGTELGATGTMGVMAGAHALSPRATPGFTPSDNPQVRAIEEALNRPLNERELYALQERQAGEAVRRMQEQPGENAQLPTQEGGGEVPSGNLPPRNEAGALGPEEARAREVSLTQGEVPTDPVERSNFEQDLIDTGVESNQRIGLPSEWRAGTPEETKGAGWIATVDESGRVVINREKFRTWLDRLKPGDRVRAMGSVFAEEGIHGIARKSLSDAEVGDLYKSLTDTERKLVEKSYGPVEEGHDPNVLYGHEYLRRQMQRMLREPVREKAEAKGYQWLKESAIDAIERVVLAVRRAVGSNASKTLDGMLERMQDHIDAAREAKGIEAPTGEPELTGAPRTMEKGAEGEEPKPEVARLGGGKYNNKQGDPLGTIYHATPEDWAAWQKQQASLLQFVKESGDLSSPEGQALFKENERIKNKYGGMPPQPPKGEAPIAPNAPRAMDKFADNIRGEETGALEERETQLKFHLDQLEHGLRAEDVSKETEARWKADYTQQLRAVQTELARRAGTGGAPRAMSRQAQERHDVVTKMREFFGGLPSRLKALPARMAGREAPRAYTASPEAANKIVEYANAKVAAPELARYLASEVLGDKWADADFSKRLGAVLVEDRLRGMKAEKRRAGNPGWRNVGTIIGKPDSPFATQADFRAALADPEIRAAIRRHRQTVEAIAAAQHKAAGGEMAGHGRHTGAFVNLDPILQRPLTQAQAAREGAPATGGRGNLTNPLRRRSRFSREAKGTAAQYELDYRKMAERMVEGNFEEAAKRRLYKQLVSDGLAFIRNPGERPPTDFDAFRVPIPIERKGVPAGGGKARTFAKNLWVRKDVYAEVRQALDVDGKIGEAALINAFNGLNQIQLAGPTDAVWHVANMLASISGSQGGKNLLVDIARKVPGVNVLDTLGRTTASAIKVLRDDPATQKQIAELAQIGAMRPEHGGGLIEALVEKTGAPEALKNLDPSRFIQLLDRAGRLVRDDLYKNMVRRGLVRDTPADRRLWVNQMGMYNARLMGPIMRWMKEQGISPFVVAGTNFNRMALRRMALSQGLKAANPKAWAQMKAVDAFGVLATLVVVPSVINYLINGNPSGRPGTKQGQIDLGTDTKDGKHLVIDPAQWTGLRRGLRITGAQSLIEGLREGQRGGRIAEQAAKDILGGALHPWAGPAVHATTVGFTGYSPTFYKESDNPKDIGANIGAALKQLNPVVGALFEGKEQHRGTLTQLGLSLGGAAGLKAVRPLTAYDRLRNINEKWMANNADPKIVRQFRQDQAMTLPESQYLDLDKFIRARDEEGAIEALRTLRGVTKDEDIMKRFMPTIGEGLNEAPKPFFHLSQQSMAKFVRTLDPEQKALYREAVKDRMKDFRFFLQVWKKKGARAEQ